MLIPAEHTTVKRDARVELNSVVIEHMLAIQGFGELVFCWPYNERLLWVEFAKLKKAAEVDFSGPFHRFRFGYANANVDRLPPEILPRQMRRQDAATNQRYIHQVDRLKCSSAGERLHVPEFLWKEIG